MKTIFTPKLETALPNTQAPLHDAYAVDYDAQVCAYDCHIIDLLFGLSYEYLTPGQRLLDVGIGSGVSSQSFARAGLEIYGLDFSPAMLEQHHPASTSIRTPDDWRIWYLFPFPRHH